jgi:mannosylglycerate hydrolase
MARRVAIVPHTHWDREWYSPFQTFRLRLVDLLDSFLPQLEHDLSYARFLLDGQMAVVDDYLEVRPEAEPRLRRLAASGRVAMGPWYTLPDEFLVSGETHVRNLQLGLDRAAAFGGAMDVGYLPDMFGHVAQMPQLLQQFGFGHAVVWRGVPSSIRSSAFWWEALDGSQVRAEYLVRGYGAGAGVPNDAKALVDRVRSYEHELGDLLVGPILFTNGTDHQAPQPWLGRVVAEANGLQDDYELAVTSLAEHLHGDDVVHDGLPVWRGELRSGARANLLMGVTSNRVDVRLAAARAERALERVAEPLCALFLPAERWPRALLDLAWREVVRNAAHDSICACSVDEVVDAVLHRYAEARQIADGMADRAVQALADSLGPAGPVAVNVAAHTRGGVVEVVVPDDTPIAGTQVLRARPGGAGPERRFEPIDFAAVLAGIHLQRLSDTFFVNAITYREETGGDELHVTFRAGVARDAAAGGTVELARRELYAFLAEHRYRAYHLCVERPPMQRLLARVAPVEGFGWRAWSAPGTLDTSSPVRTDGHSLTNGLVTVDVDASAGTFAIDGVAGYGRIVDGGDAGDTYNWCPPAGGDALVDAPRAVEVEVTEHGPVRATAVIRATYRLPERLDEGSGVRTGAVDTVITTTVSVHAGETLVRASTAWENRSRDHRLRVLLPLRERATSSRAECAFATVERGLEAEGGPGEQGLPTFPAKRFVQAGGVTVVHDRVLEYEVVDDDRSRGVGQALALTLLRATGWLSRGPMSTRLEAAGPVVAAGGAQLLGPVEVRYGICADAGADPYRLADDAFLPLRMVEAPGGGPHHGTGGALTITGAEVSAVRRVPDGKLEVRVFNPTGDGTVVDLGDRRGWLVDLRGRPLSPVEGRVPLAPWRIATLHLDGD